MGYAPALAIAILVTINPVNAQIVPDNTLLVNSSVAPGCTACTIEGGTVRGSNLFHSFSEFSVPTGGEAFFNNDATLIQNIFTRVTGNSASNIDGLIRANGTANLFLINPNGIVFNSNASLNIGGSFIASTANSLNFSDRIKFSTVNSQTPPLLTINVPIGLQFGTNPGSIQVLGSSLEVNPGQTLALVGGNMQLDGGQLLAQGGNVELGGMADNGTVDLSINGSDFGLSFPDGVERANVSLSNGTNVNVLAGAGGSIAINARSLDMTGGSTQLRSGIASGLGSVDSQAGDIEINATQAINLNGSRISNRVQSTAVGNSGDINITTGSLRVSNGAILNTETSGVGNAGSINIVARDTVSFDGFDGASSSKPTGAISAVQSTGVGKGGNINITTGSLFVMNRGQLVATNRGGKGDAGRVDIVARDTVVFDQGLGNNPTGAFSNVFPNGVGNGASINITTGSLYLRNGGVLNVRTQGKGNAGSVNIFARDTVSFDGVSPNGTYVTSVVSAVETGAEGQGGNINITTGSLSVTNGAQLSAATSGVGNAGNMNIVARDTVSLEGAGKNGVPSGAYSSVESTGIGKGGDINITAKILSLKDGAFLSVRTSGQRDEADGGNITLRADTLEAISGGQIISTSNGIGKAGNINLNLTDSITLSGSDANYFARLDQFIARLDPNLVQNVDPVSGLFANTSETSTGRGGELTINTKHFNIRDGAQVTVSSQGSGIAGSLLVEANSIYLDNKAKISADTKGGQGNINLLARDLLLLRRGSSITTNATGAATGGNITITTDNLVAVPKENSDISANAENSFGGRVIVNASGIFGTQFRLQPTPLSDITASSARGSEFNGVVQLNTPDVNPSQGLTALPTNIIDTSQLIANSCIARSKRPEGKFIITGNGGLPVMPDDPSIAPYQTYQIPTVQSASISTPQENALDLEDSITGSKPHNPPKSAPLIEAQGWVYGSNGEVILTAFAPTVAPHSSWLQLSTCSGS
ncbi:filamentous hemagglutinin N-terminal domain-containing protein [Nostoc sp. CHAB 5784]|uniref:two-partner secretion domain-containing protein n=1 Tax=Nostoc mirabile TaxID=2907820 RepID=UPI001E3A75D4|nr:filamentous hemagglutinin N-terminal domain-containing protein [Nostoc mirabile]MCC5669909.1 filamentous hemagglutinin N-terminal domain-containing protein [Nostoc mirabile CHAB5784]